MYKGLSHTLQRWYESEVSCEGQKQKYCAQVGKGCRSKSEYPSAASMTPARLAGRPQSQRHGIVALNGMMRHIEREADVIEAQFAR